MLISRFLRSFSSSHQSLQPSRIRLQRIRSITRHLFPRNAQHHCPNLDSRLNDLYLLQLWTPLQIPTSRISQPIRDHPGPTILWKQRFRNDSSSRSRSCWCIQLFDRWKLDERIEWILNWWNKRSWVDQGFDCWICGILSGRYRSSRLKLLSPPLFPLTPLLFFLYLYMIVAL